MRFGRSPLGLRGLKFFVAHLETRGGESQPSWAAWIEMTMTKYSRFSMRSQPSWAAWIEIIPQSYLGEVQEGRSPLGLRGLKFCANILLFYPLLSQPSWAAWIEMQVVLGP